MFLNNIVKNKVLFYLTSRYATYFIQFVTSLVIAVRLGPYYMGIWGFILLLLNYFQQCHFGITNSFNVLYVHHKNDKECCDNYIANTIVLLAYLCIIVFIIYILYIYGGEIYFVKYHIDKYAVWICIIAVLQYYQSFFINLFRVKNELYFVAFCQSIIVLLNFICIFFFTGERLINTLVAGYVIGNLFCFILAVLSKDIPSYKKITIKWKIQSEIFQKGLFLFLYNSCFYFIIISIRTIISAYYSVEEFGLFTFSFTVAHAILLLLEAFIFIIFPKVISKLSSNNVSEVRDTIVSLRQLYITSAHLLIYIALIVFPFFVQLMPKYEGTITCMNLIALTILMNSNVVGYAELMIARNQERRLSVLSFSALVINSFLGIIMVKVFHMPFDFVILATMVAYFLYSLCVMWFGEKKLHTTNFTYIIFNYFPLRLLLPYISSIVISVLRLGDFFTTIPLLLFLIMNVGMYQPIKKAVLKILHNPNVVNV